MVSVVGAELDELVREDGEILEALQELTRLAVVRETGQRTWLMLDVKVSCTVSACRSGKPALAQRSVEEARSSGDRCR